jgi:virulence-associated protein VapD
MVKGLCEKDFLRKPFTILIGSPYIKESSLQPMQIVINLWFILSVWDWFSQAIRRLVSFVHWKQPAG